jgi:AcrR family transcriptional regulator
VDSRKPAAEPSTPSLLEAVCSAGLRVADAEGLARLTIRRVAAAAGVAAMTTYGAIASKDELITLIADRALAEFTPPPSSDGPWQDDLVEIMAELRALMLLHPSLPQIFATRRISLGTSVGLAVLVDSVLHQLGRGGVTGRAAVTGFFNLLTYALGYVLFELPRREAVQGLPGHGPVAPSAVEVLRMASRHNLTALAGYADELGRSVRLDSYEDGVRALLAGMAR